jgi:putative transposase
MQTNFPVEYPQFFTATILDWKHLLADDNHKNIIIDSLQFMVSNKRIILNAFVIMNNHIHLIWQPCSGYTPSDIQASFMKYTAQQLKQSLIKNEQEIITEFKVNKYDRTYQFWKREPLSVALRTHEVFMQKLEYIHYNPVRAGLCINPVDYHYSSAGFYHGGIDNFKMLTHFSGN